ncbi:MAG: ABC transporter ATP-binding protein [Lachnospiraceae bacterium]|nr:ABC transporter ATP-binding protein [Lachnospiraceae bacterium]MDY5742351.1 ABC transporter ATP-binding protein [Lachnospiraceae bacterium]
MRAVEVKHLYKQYRETMAVEDLSFTIEEGELFALLGENGAGKSTTINILCTILAKSGGTVSIFDRELGKEDDKIRRQIGIVFQQSVLDDQLTVEQNLMTRGAYYGFSGRETKTRLEPFWEPLSLGEIWKKRYGRLSGGQRRKVDIVRALLHRPRLLIMDEPTTGLDPLSRKIVWDYIHLLRREQGLTILLTTHYMEECNQADRVVVLDHGQKIADDTPTTLKRALTKTRVLWYAERSKSSDELLSAYPYSHTGEYYELILDERDITEFLYQNRDQVKDYEVIKGSMDDVFLTLTGREMAV